MKNIFIVCLIPLIIFGCKKKISPEEQLEEDIKIIEKYIADNNLSATKTSSGLHYVITEVGTGNHPTQTDDVTVRYRGYYVDNTTFDQSEELGVTFNLQQVIQGWTEGVPKLKEGGSGILLIPSGLAYGEKGSGPVPPNTVLIFEIDLLDIPG
ncbi:MAG: FKBP-type peptidyl-prolyl cis-trans isomerase [Brumimicrobium sp.]|nr:FKBP-type peptidyl-prolyl cis-trans isomerase [Brumimicrobium sp.]